MSYESLLIQTADVYQRTHGGIDQYGAESVTYTLLYSQIPCRSMHKKQTFGEVVGKVGADATHTIYVSKDYQLDTTMRVVIGGSTFQLTHADMKFDSIGNHHAVYEGEVVESPQSGA